jgi:drug/metabolite transporter (DMT)-like permease
VLRCQPVKNPKLLQADLSLLAITLIWGASFTIVKLSLAQASPILFICLRFWVAAVVTAAFMPRAFTNLSFQTLRRGLVLSLALLSGFIFQTLGLRTTTPSRSAFITCLCVLLVPVLGFFLFHHRPRLRTLLGVGMATIGLGLLTLNAIPLKLNRGDVLTLICAIVFALHILLIGRYLRTSDFRQLVILQLCGSAVISTLILPMLETPFLVWDFSIAVYLFVTGVLATGLAIYIQNRAQQYTTPNRTALIFSLEPFFAALIAYQILGQNLSAKEWAGGGLVLAGILTSEFRRDRVTS